MLVLMPMLPTALLNAETSILVQRRHSYTRNSNSEMSGDSENASPHCGNVFSTTIGYAGMKGGTVLNPINALAKLLAGMVDDDHHITVEGFYE